MNRSNWRETAELVGIAAIVASLIFVGLELQQSRQIAYDAATKTEAELIIAVQSIVTQNSDVWMRGCRGEELNDSEQLLFAHIFHAFDTLYFLRFVSSRAEVSSAGLVASVNTTALNVHRNPGYRRAWEERFAWRPRDTAEANLLIRFRDLVNARVAELAKIEPEPLKNTSRCGLS